MDASPLSSFPTVAGEAALAGRTVRSLYQVVHGGAGPDRYIVRQQGPTRALYCHEAPEVRVRIEHGLSFTTAAARKAEAGTIFLDGVCQGPPFLDAERRVFNLDHHADCVRQFTLSSCEQALVLVRRGLDMREHTWALYANDPDLDTVLAIWLLLNAAHVAENPELRAAIAPLIRVEGALDVHGREGLDLVALPADVLERTLQRLDELRRNEQAARRGGPWARVDALEFAAVQLRAIDAMVFPPNYFEGFRHVEALASAELSNHRVAVVCRSDQGIFEAEQDLKKLYGKRLGVVALEKEPHVYTLRQVDSFLPGSLELAYARLNILDPAVRSGGSRNRWGGSAEIGGSPRQTGTRLSPQEIAEACRQAYRKPTWRERATALVAAPLVALAALAGGEPSLLSRFVPAWSTLATPPWRSAVGISLLASFFLFLFGRKRPRLYGIRLPGGSDWLWTAPLALLGAAAGGAWVAPAPHWTPMGLAVLLAFPLAAELLFRGVVHGILARAFAIQHDGGRWFLSLPTAISALLYAVAAPISPIVSAAGPWGFLVSFGSALLFAMAAGVARERSGSVLAPLVLHWTGAVLALFSAGYVATLLR